MRRFTLVDVIDTHPLAGDDNPSLIRRCTFNEGYTLYISVQPAFHGVHEYTGGVITGLGRVFPEAVLFLPDEDGLIEGVGDATFDLAADASKEAAGERKCEREGMRSECVLEVLGGFGIDEDGGEVREGGGIGAGAVDFEVGGRGVGAAGYFE